MHSHPTLFTGAGTTTDFVPEGFELGALIAQNKPAAVKWAPAMRAVLAQKCGAGHWPPQVGRRGGWGYVHTYVCLCCVLVLCHVVSFWRRS